VKGGQLAKAQRFFTPRSGGAMNRLWAACAKLGLAGLVCLLLWHTAAYPSTAEPAETKRVACQEDLRRINQRLGDKDCTLDAFEELADSLDCKWQREDPHCHARVMTAISGALASGRFPDQRQYKLARRYALSALRDPDKITLDRELSLIGWVWTRRRGMEDRVFQENRRLDTHLWLHAWKRLTAAAIPNWNIEEASKGVFVHVLPPNGAPPGTPPEMIKDQAVRAEYEKMILENDRKKAAIAEQWRIQNSLKTFPANAEAYLISAYSEAPHDLKELQLALDSYLSDGDAKSRIVQAVTKNMKQQEK
jgi:hypothetical protein